jgi:hypothetical protein
MTVGYEWDVETHVTYNNTGDIDSMDVLDHDYCESAKQAKTKAARTPEAHSDGVTSHYIVLVRDDDDRRAWAYVVDGKLPDHFEDADGRPTTTVGPWWSKESAARAADGDVEGRNLDNLVALFRVFGQPAFSQLGEGACLPSWWPRCQRTPELFLVA